MHDAIVVGAGVAGSAAAALLARRGHDVLLLEADRYPAHKMCGEFLSPESARHFRALGVEADVWDRGAVAIRRVAVTSPSGASWRGALPRAGIGLSRWALDPILFDAARRAGATALQSAPVTAVEGDAREGFRVRYRSEGAERLATARLVVGAFGKRARLDRALERPAGGGDFVAFKAHHAGDDLEDWVELHAFDGGYCGMSHVEDGRVNVCLIASTRALKEGGRSFEAMRDGVMRTNRSLAARFDRLELATDRVVSIGQIPFGRRELFARDVMMVGDTAALIAPLCGDGMAMALRSAEIGALCADDRLAGRTSFEEMRASYARAWRREFAGRLRVGRALQYALFRPGFARAGLGALGRAPSWVGAALIRMTRG